MGHGWAMDGPALSSLDLTAEQMEKVRSLRESGHEEMAPIWAQKFEKKSELKLLWMQMTPDPEKIKARQKEIHDLKWQIQEKIIGYRLAFRDILTPEQLTKFLAMGGGLGPRHKRGRGDHHGHGMEPKP